MRKLNNNRLWITHAKALADAWQQMMQRPLSTLMTCIIIAMTLLLTVTFSLTLKTLQHLTEFVNASNQVTLYIKPNIKEQQIYRWIDQLKQNSMINQVTYISKDQALQELTAQANYKEILTNVSENPLPAVILLKINSTDNNDIERFSHLLKNVPLVASINVDFDWLKRLSALIKLGNRISYALSIALGIGVLCIIGNAIQSATQGNQQEVYLLQLIGASVAYIRRPFLYFGLLLGMGAGLVTLFLLFMLFISLKQPMLQCLQSYNLHLTDAFAITHIILEVMIMSTLLGLFGAWLAFYRYIKLV